MRFLIFYYLIVPVFVLVGGIYFVFTSLPPSSIVIEAGPAGGFFAQVAHRIAQGLKTHDIEARVVHVDDTTNILSRVNTGGGTPAIGFSAQNTDGVDTAAVSSLGAVALEPLFIFARRELRIGNIRELRGKKIAVGPVGSGTRALGEPILRLYGIDEANSGFVPIHVLDAANALEEGRVDAALFLLPAETPLIREIGRDPDFALVSLGEAAAIAKNITFLENVAIPKGTFDLTRPLPGKNIEAVAVPVTVVMSDEAGVGLGTLVANILYEKYSGETALTNKHDLPRFYNEDIPALAEAKEIYSGPLPSATKIFGIKYGLLISYAAKPMIIFLVFAVLVLGTIITYVEIVPVLLSVRDVFQEKRVAREDKSATKQADTAQPDRASDAAEGS